MEKNGTVVLSGILSDQVQKVISAYKEWFIFESPVYLKGWVRLVGKKKL